MRTNKTNDSLTWMSKMRLSYNALTQQLDAWLMNVLNTNKRQYGKYTVFGILIESFKQLCTLIFTQIVVGTKEHNILTAEQTASVRGLAQLACYKAVSAVESSGQIQLDFSADASTKLSPTVYIKRGAKLKCNENSLVYSIAMNDDFQQCVLNNDAISHTYTFAIKQGEYANQQFVSNGTSLQMFDLIERNDFISESSIVVEVNNNVWTKYMSFAEMQRDTEGYIVQWSFDGNLQIVFGNGTTGKLPEQNAIINVTYLKCAGYDGNVLIDNDASFEWLDGMFDAQMQSINPKDSLTITQITDIVGGYNGDDIETIRQNAGAINRSLVLHSAESIKLYMQRFSHYSIIDIWSNTDSQIIHVVAVPNIRDKYIKAGSLVYSYWNLPLSEFVLSNTDIEYLQNAIKSNQDYVLLTEIKFDMISLIYFKLYILCKKKYELQNNQDIKQQILSTVTEHIQNSWDTEKQFISRSAIIAQIEALNLVETVDATFDSDIEDNLQWIDSLGNINVTDKYKLPLIRSTEGTDISLSIKVLIETNGQYIEV